MTLDRKLMACAYPECNNILYITTQQKRELKTFDYLKYGVSSDLYCSKQCQEKHLEELSEAEFVQKGSLKNREYCLKIHDVEVTKRPKEKEVTLVTGNKTEQRAKCLRAKLESMVLRRFENKMVKYLFPNEVQEFISTGLPPKLKVSPTRVQVTASELIKIVTEIYPNEVCREKFDGKTHILLFIK